MDCFVIDDELCVAQSICEYFELFELTCSYATSYQEGLAFLQEHPVGVLLLDINLGEASGYSLCKEIRKKFDMPVLFISARNTESDILTALGVGGDDLIPKPFSLTVLYAKVTAVLKRHRSQQEAAVLAEPKKNLIRFGPVTVDPNKAAVVKDGLPVILKPMEWRLFLYLLEHSERVLSKEELLSQVWQEEFIGEGTLSVHIRHLREKLEDNPNQPRFIKTVWGTGYMMERNQ